MPRLIVDFQVNSMQILWIYGVLCPNGCSFKSFFGMMSQLTQWMRWMILLWMRRPLPEIEKNTCSIKYQTSIRLTFVFLISCLFTWLFAEHFKIFRVYNVALILRAFYECIGLTAYFSCRAATSILAFRQDNLLQYFHYISSNRALSQLFCFCVKAAMNFVWLIELGRKLQKLHDECWIFMEMFQCSLDLPWNCLIFDWD